MKQVPPLTLPSFLPVQLSHSTNSLLTLTLILSVCSTIGCRSIPFRGNPFSPAKPTVEDMLAVDIPTEFESADSPVPTTPLTPPTVSPPTSFASHSSPGPMGYSLPKPSGDALNDDMTRPPRNAERQQELLGNYGLEEIWPDDSPTESLPQTTASPVSLPMPGLPTPKAPNTNIPPRESLGAQPFSATGSLPTTEGRQAENSSLQSLAYPRPNQIQASANPSARPPEVPTGGLTVAELSVAIRGASGRGAMKVAVFGPASSFPDPRTALQRLDYPAGTKDFRISLPGQGTFALAVYEDLNGDGTLNRSRFGVPTEPYGFSNNARSNRGAPSFQEAQLSWPATQRVEIALQ